MDQYYVLGNPIAHSKSPLIHARFAELTGQTLRYERLLVPLESFAATLAQLQRDGVKGCNVTVPFKLDAFERRHHAQRPGPAGAGRQHPGAARRRRACRQHRRRGPGERHPEQRRRLAGRARRAADRRGRRGRRRAGAAAGRRAAPAGAGQPHAGQGRRAGRAAQGACLPAGPAPGKPNCWPKTCRGCEAPSTWSSTPARAAWRAAGVPVAASVLKPGALACDMMYGPAAAGSMAWAQDSGAVPRDGLGMLVEQAAEAFELWRKVRLAFRAGAAGNAGAAGMKSAVQADRPGPAGRPGPAAFFVARIAVMAVVDPESTASSALECLA